VANISDSSGVVVGATLNAWIVMQAAIARDGDTAGASEALRKAFVQIASTVQTPNGGTGTSSTKRK